MVGARSHNNGGRWGASQVVAAERAGASFALMVQRNSISKKRVRAPGPNHYVLM